MSEIIVDNVIVILDTAAGFKAALLDLVLASPLSPDSSVVTFPPSFI